MSAKVECAWVGAALSKFLNNDLVNPTTEQQKELALFPAELRALIENCYPAKVADLEAWKLILRLLRTVS